MKLADYIAEYLSSLGTRHVFVVTGGAIAHLVDALGNRAQKKGDITYVCVQHEQAGAMAAETYSRLGSGIGVAMTTSGPGATNLITGICGCYFDSIPTLFITGQVNTKESIESIAVRPRQVGFQETDIVNIVKPITKYAVQIRDPLRIRFELEKAVFIARYGRPGPVLLDVPVDIQVADITPETLEAFNPTSWVAKDPQDSDAVLKEKILETVELIRASTHPVILFGGGIRLAGAEKEALIVAEQLGFPLVVSWSGFDLIPHSHPQFIGPIGVYGNRGANFVIQNADLLISLGSRLDTRQTGGKVSWFVRGAKSVMVDIDRNELEKCRGFTPTIAVHADVKRFLQLFSEILPRLQRPMIASWWEKARQWGKKYPAVLSEYYNGPTINAYAFIKTLSDAAEPGDIVIPNEGGNLVWTMQSWMVKKGQRVISTFGNSPMGYAFPAAIGAAFALPGKPIICIDGDGGFQLNIQELQTVVHYQLPLKIFILNNRSMGIIKQFQDWYFDSRYHASAPEGHYTSPDFVKIANAYGMEAFVIERPSEMEGAVKRIFENQGPILCNVLIDVNQKIIPKLEFGRPLEDMSPYLSDKEFFDNMLIEPLPRRREMRGWQEA